MEGQYNMRNPAVKRLMREARELKDPNPQYHAQPFEDNLFEWHFTVAGPPDTAFAGGRYHGRILLPPEYPMKPPSIIILTPNGRFEVGSKICLSVSGYHPETWQPSWSIRTVLIALIGFMPSKGGGAIGALDYPAEERQKLARRSREWTCPSCGLSMHQSLPDGQDGRTFDDSAEQELAAQINFKGEKEKKQTEKETPSAVPAATAPDHIPADISSSPPSSPSQQDSNTSTSTQQTDESSVRHRQTSVTQSPSRQEEKCSQPPVARRANDRLLQLLIWLVLAIIMALIIRRMFML